VYVEILFYICIDIKTKDMDIASLLLGIYIGVGVSALSYISYNLNRLERRAKKRSIDYHNERQIIINSL
jgi:hypothetical protein